MAYGPPPSPGQGQQPGWQQQPPQQQSPWQQPGSAWQQPQQPPQPGGAWQQPPQQDGPGQAWQQPAQGRGTTPMPGHYGPVSDDEKTWSLMAYLGQFLVGAIAPAIVYLGKARSPFVRRHAAQGLNMGLAAIAVWIVGGLLALAVDVLIWVPLLFTAAVLFFLVYAARAANRGEFRTVPVVVAWPIVK
ncbi:DUF4870 domain-containing protein [Actinomadura montaniterrae]|uniref:DUF4870 domain-containing protein n=1 Tax=Actinomadura montaniterrae TaxID=1803903 RepID=A0A6L3W139_9ACTN|nr:DUF4870 domain-containing protein [Actinomadura montaniterrae]KAB2388595.1 DUF4870 domain-containing protein [Actinomadura montaniterrae]